ncbi:MAG: F0F1 ATP synthase subunit alpha [Anaerolineae bacterium]
MTEEAIRDKLPAGDAMVHLREEIAGMSGLPTSADALLASLREQIGGPPTVEKLRPGLDDLPEILREHAKRFRSRVYFQDVGTVQHIGNGVATLSGLPRVRSDELVTFPTGVEGMVLNLERRRIDVILLGPDEGIQGGALVTATGQRLQVPVGPGLLGRVVDVLGRPLDDDGEIEAAAFRFVEREAPDIIERTPVREPLHTGLKVIDALLPIGRGQRELIAGNRKTGKTSLAVDAILNQKGSGVLCFYAAIGQKKSTTLAALETLREGGAMAHTTVVISSPDDPPALRYLAPYAACTMAEYLALQQGRDVLVIYDDLSKHADAYRELSLLLRRPPGREAYPGDIFYLHARLLERACKVKEEAGGGSLTALPIVELQQGNVSAYIPTNLISINDGQIILDADLFNRDIKPAVNVGASVSRVGGQAQTDAMRDVAEMLRLELSQFEEVERFARFGTEVEETTQHQIERGRRLQAILTQPVHQPLSLGQQVAILFAATEGYTDSVDIDELDRFEKDLLDCLEREHQDLLSRIRHTRQLSDEIRGELHEAMEGFRDKWLDRRSAS